MAIALAGGVSLDWLAHGREKGNSPGEDEEWLELPMLAFRASGGRGALVFEGEGESFVMARRLLDRLGVRPEHARALVLEGDSMRPTIGDGDTVVLDLSSDRFIDGRIFAFTIGNEAYVKRLRRAPGRLLMVSDNPDFPPEPIPREEDFRIIGQVKWAERLL